MSRPNETPPTAAQLLEDIERLIAHCGVVRPVLVGHSLGGNLAQELVRRAPGSYAGLMVLDATWNTGPIGRGERLLLRLAAPGLALIPAGALPGVMARVSAVTGSARADAVRAFSQVSTREFLDIWRAPVSLLQPDPGYRTPVPLRLLRGGADRTGNLRTAMSAGVGCRRRRDRTRGSGRGPPGQPGRAGRGDRCAAWLSRGA